MFAKLATVVGILSGVFAVITFFWSASFSVEQQKEEDLRNWQRTIVYEIVVKAAPQAISFDDLLTRYDRAVNGYRSQLRRPELGRQFLRRVMLDLIQKKAVEHRPNDAYALSSSPPKPPTSGAPR